MLCQPPCKSPTWTQDLGRVQRLTVESFAQPPILKHTRRIKKIQKAKLDSMKNAKKNDPIPGLKVGRGLQLYRVCSCFSTPEDKEEKQAVTMTGLRVPLQPTL